VAGETARGATGVRDDAAGFPAMVEAGGGASVFTRIPFGSGVFDDTAGGLAGAVVTGCSSPARRAAKPVPGDRKISIAKKARIANTP